jgi:hypothetical protein
VFRKKLPHCLKLILLFVIYHFESETGLQFDLQRRDLDLAGYVAGKTCMLYWHSDWSGSVNCFSIKNYRSNRHGLPILVALRSKAWVCGRTFARTADSSPAWDMDVCLLECRVLSGEGLTVGLITRPEES